MPNVQVTIYLNKDEYLQYIERQEEINAIARDSFKNALYNEVVGNGRNKTNKSE